MKILIMAGGKGERMLPYTTVVPKPLLPYKGRPIIDYIFDNLKAQNIKDITISLGYGADLVSAYVLMKKYKATFIRESNPLGTVGSLSLIDFKTPLLVTYGDIICSVNYKDLYNYHLKNKACITITTVKITYSFAYGHLEIDKNLVTRFNEKPVYNFVINSGVFVINPAATKYLDEKTEFNDLVNRAIEAGELVCAYPHKGFYKAMDKPEHLVEE